MEVTSMRTKRVQYKPFEYPEVLQYIDLIHKTFWIHSEVNFTADIQDYNTNLSDVEKEVVRRSLLAISQVEVNVKLFWGKLYDMFPKPEFNLLGSCFADNEGRHSEAYSRLLTELGLERDFDKVIQEPVFIEREKMYSEIVKTEKEMTRLLLFTILIENASLFSQFANILSFQRFRGMMKNVANIIAWTASDEALGHAKAGIFLIRQLIREGEELNIGELNKYVETEMKVIDWIYEKGELSFFTKNDVKGYVRKRINDALTEIAGITYYKDTIGDKFKWFDEEVFADKLDDFFARRPVDYTKHTQSITEEDLF